MQRNDLGAASELFLLTLPSGDYSENDRIKAAKRKTQTKKTAETQGCGHAAVTKAEAAGL
jgi:hypothetical protein